MRDVHEYEGDDMAAVLMTNVVGYVRVIHAFLPLLERSSDPRIVNVSSGLGSFALAHDQSPIESPAHSPLYAAAKSAINMLTLRYAQLLPEIRTNAADPGMTTTDLVAGRGTRSKTVPTPSSPFALGRPDSPTAAAVQLAVSVDGPSLTVSLATATHGTGIGRLAGARLMHRIEDSRSGRELRAGRGELNEPY